jgi:hypothetical protein
MEFSVNKKLHASHQNNVTFFHFDTSLMKGACGSMLAEVLCYKLGVTGLKLNEVVGYFPLT